MSSKQTSSLGSFFQCRGHSTHLCNYEVVHNCLLQELQQYEIPQISQDYLRMLGLFFIDILLVKVTNTSSHSWTIYCMLYFHLPTKSGGVCNVMSQRCNPKRGKKSYCKNMTTPTKENRLLLHCKYLIHRSGKHADKKRIKCHWRPLADYVSLTISYPHEAVLYLKVFLYSLKLVRVQTIPIMLFSFFFLYSLYFPTVYTHTYLVTSSCSINQHNFTAKGERIKVFMYPACVCWEVWENYLQ